MTPYALAAAAAALKDAEAGAYEKILRWEAASALRVQTAIRSTETRRVLSAV